MMSKIIRLALLCLLALSYEPAVAWNVHGSGPVFTHRSVLNVGLMPANDYAFINYIQEATNYPSPFSSGFTSGTVWNSDILDSSGVPNNVAALNTGWGGGLHVAPSANFAGPYVFQGVGTGHITFQLNPTNAFTDVPSGVTCNGHPAGFGYSFNLISQSLTVTDSGSGWCVVLTYSGTNSLANFQISDNTNGAFIKNLAFYQKADEADFLAGKIFRAGFKQPIVNLDPGAVRFMNWGPGANGFLNVRFENRTLPGQAGLSGVPPFKQLPPYGQTTGTNQYALAGVTGTPVAMTHGEEAIARIGSSTTCNQSFSIASISAANPAQITTNAASCIANGDKVAVHDGALANLNHFPVIATVIDSTHFTIPVDLTGGGCAASCGGVTEFLSLNVGGRGDFPVVFQDGIVQLPTFLVPLTATSFVTFVFDKNSTAQTDGAGHNIFGVWLWGGLSTMNFGVPLEIMTAFVNELNAMSPTHPINMWVNLPHMGLIPSDPDYTTGSDFPVNMINVILNGANGFAGLCAQCQLIVENSNEDWNTAGGFPQTPYFARQGFLRYANGTTDFGTFSTLRSLLDFKDIRNSAAMQPRVKFAMMGCALACGTLSSGDNHDRVFGNSFITNDVLNTWGPNPYTQYNAFGYASYFDADTSFDTANLANYAAMWVADTGNAAAQEADCALYVAGVVTGAVNGQTISAFLTRDQSTIATLKTIGLPFIQYEGGWDHSVSSGTTDVNNFLIAVKQSQAWANAQAAYFQTFVGNLVGMPSVYVEIDKRWGYAFPDTFSGTTEGAGLSKTWTSMSGYNQGQQ